MNFAKPEKLLISFLASDMAEMVFASTNSCPPSLPCQSLDKEPFSLRWFFNFCHKNSLKSYKMFSRKKNRKLFNKFAEWGWMGSHFSSWYNIVNIPFHIIQKSSHYLYSLFISFGNNKMIEIMNHFKWNYHGMWLLV